MLKMPQLVKYNHLDVVPIVEWETPPTVAELEQQFGAMHFGLRRLPSVCPTEGAAPGREEMDDR